YRVDPLARVRGQVLVAQVAAVVPEVRVDGAGDVALVEGVAPALGDLLQGVGQVRVAPGLTGARRAAVDGELRGEARPLRQHRHRARPVVRDHLVHRVALARVADGGRQYVGHRQ